jgi:hypothetical protein
MSNLFGLDIFDRMVLESYYSIMDDTIISITNVVLKDIIFEMIEELNNRCVNRCVNTCVTIVEVSALAHVHTLQLHP